MKEKKRIEAPFQKIILKSGEQLMATGKTKIIEFNWGSIPDDEKLRKEIFHGKKSQDYADIHKIVDDLGTIKVHLVYYKCEKAIL